MNQDRYIKIPEGAIRKANEIGILKDLEFYYQLKVVNEEGFFPNGSVARLIQGQYKIAQSSIWRKIKTLSKLDLIRKEENGYRLVKYDKLFSILGYDLKYQTVKKRQGTFKIFKLSLDKIDELISHTAKEEIDLNLNRQAYKVYKKVMEQSRFKKLLRKECTQPISLTEAKGFIDRLYKKIDKVAHFKETQESISAIQYIKASGKYSADNTDYCNLDITLSNRGITNLLGFKTTLKGFQIQNRLVELNLIKSTKRKVYVESFDLTYKEFRAKFKDPSYRLKDSMIYRILPNKITVL